MTEETLKCVKGESCIHCGSTYCRFVDEVNELEQENKELRKANEISIEKVTVTAEAKRLQELEQENKELKELNKKICEDWEKEIKVYWNALEEIREDLVKLKTNDEDDFTYEYSKIEDKVNEVLNEKEL